MKNWVVMIILYKKVKSIKKENKIIINAVPICKGLPKIGVREPKVANINDTLVCQTPTLSKWLPDGII